MNSRVEPTEDWRQESRDKGSRERERERADKGVKQHTDHAHTVTLRHTQAHGDTQFVLHTPNTHTIMEVVVNDTVVSSNEVFDRLSRLFALQ